jgi:5-methylcytosine-specific restriction endonuclease McrA
MPNYDEINQKVTMVFDCNCQKKVVRYKLTKASTKIFFLQCLTCGDTTRIPKDKVTNPDSFDIKLVDEELRDKWWKARDNYRSQLYREHEIKEKKEWFDWYDTYLKSPMWAKKRAVVLKRANYICEGCLEKPATQVHHLTYKHVGNEMLFDLVAICDDCHRIIHDSENK